MKTFLKHKYGYLNLDDDFIYLTKTGNWSETKNLKEKNYKDFRKADLKSKIKIISYLLLVGGLFTFGILSNIASGKISYLLLIGLPILFYTTYNYLIPEIGASFLIPHSKIKSIEMDNGDTIIYFTDFEGKEDLFNLKGLDEKGIEVLLNINLSKT